MRNYANIKVVCGLLGCIFQKSPVLLAYLSSLFERTRTPSVQASKIVLNVCEVVFKIPFDQIFKFELGRRIVGNEWNAWWVAGPCASGSCENKPNDQRRDQAISAQPKVQKSHKNLIISVTHAYWMCDQSLAAHV